MNRKRQTDEEANPPKKQKRMEEDKCKKKTVRPLGLTERTSSASQPSTHPLSLEEWREWLQRNHDRATGVWLVSFKKTTGKPHFEYDVAVAEDLCFGWIDIKPNKLDEERTLLWFAPRKAGTGWSRPNKIRIDQMMQSGLMAEAGLRKVEQARLDGSWAKLDAVENLEIPEDLQSALAAFPEATKNFDAFPRSAKRGILEWIANAKTTTTRANRVNETAMLTNKNQRANQWIPKQTK
jgi:uncharacterized protein YdeI (YjbR/CyaY-like superfamily)